MIKKRVIELLLFSSISIHLWGQAECNETFAYVLGSIGQDEKGYSLAASDKQQAVYAAGIKGDSAVIIKIAYSGKIEWVRAFDIVPGKQDHIVRILVDSDDMIAAAGIAGTTDAGGSVFIFRYNPASNTILWSAEIKNTINNYCNGLIQKGPGGNYLLIDNNLSPRNILEIIEIDKNTGNPTNQLSKHYDDGGPSNLSDAIYANGKIYGTGRFSRSYAQQDFRNTIVRLNGDNGDFEWVFLGHLCYGVGTTIEARLYGASLVLDQNFIYSVYCGDNNGTSLDQTSIFIQKTKEDFNLVWIKQYDIPGTNDWADEIIKSDNGFVILARNRTSPSDIILFKINENGDVLWSKRFDFSVNDNGIPIGSTQTQLIEANQHLYFTAISDNSNSTDIILVKTDLHGDINDNCIEMTPLNMAAKTIISTCWFTWEPNVTDFLPIINILPSAHVTSTDIETKTVCQLSNLQMSIVQANICNGDTYDGYSLSGQYIDHFLSYNGCDSTRTLILNVTNSIITTKDILLCDGQLYDGYTETGIYTDTFASHFGCDSIRTLHLQINEPISTSVQTTLCGGNLAGYSAIGKYVDTLQAINGCDSIRTLIIKDASKYIPNVFSPNNDGINDMFMVFQTPDNSYPLQYFAIFDRAGNMAYQTTEWPIRWNGESKNGEPYNSEVFAYVFIYLCGDEKITETGDITIVK